MMRWGWVALLLASTEPECGMADMDAVRGNAAHWLKEMGYQSQGVSCSDVDSDGDGYVSCSANVAGHSEPIAIECRSYVGRGCRMAREKMEVRRR